MFSRFARVLLGVVVLLVFAATTSFFHSSTRSQIDPLTGELFGDENVESSPFPPPTSAPAVNAVSGGVIMGKLGNATAKAELGRSTWKLLHTVTLRYPERPTRDERDALLSYLHLTSRLYPCGECAAEFQELLKQYPPQTSSRRSAALWLCFVHNKVNERLGKPDFDCANLDGTYDCGCGDNPIVSKKHEIDELTGETMIKGGR